ncbi:MAG: hypothetical protein ABI478_10755, partial [Propionivibrio sp.]
LSGTAPDEERRTGDWSLRLSTELSDDRSKTVTEGQRAILRLEYQLLAAIYDQASQQLSIAGQIRQLETTVAALKTATQASLGTSAGGGSASVGLTPPAAVATPAAPAPAKADAARDEGLPSGWLWLVGLLAAVALLVWLFHRSTSKVTRSSLSVDGEGERDERDEREAGVDLPPANSLSLAPATVQAAPRVAELVRPIGQSVDETLILDQHHESHDSRERKPFSAALPDSMNGTTALIEHYEFDPVMELAEIMLAFGRVKGAVEALQEYLDAHPDGAVQPWMKLIEIYRQNDMQADYEKLAPQFAAIYNVQPAAWDELPELAPAPLLDGSEAQAPVDELLTRTPEIAAIPEIREAIVRQWATPEGMQETLVDLNTLLRDKTNAVQQTMSLAMVNEVLFLQAVLVKRLAKTK